MTSQKYTGMMNESFSIGNGYRDPKRKKKAPNNPDRKKKKLPRSTSTLQIGVVNYDK